MQEVASFNNLSDNLKREILPYLQFTDIFSLRLTNKRMFNLLSQDKTWQIVQRVQKVKNINMEPLDDKHFEFIQLLYTKFPIYFYPFSNLPIDSYMPLKQQKQTENQQIGSQFIQKMNQLKNKLFPQQLQQQTNTEEIGQNQSQQIDLLELNAISASTTDYTQSVFWSSTGTQNGLDRDEYLYYSFKNDFTLVKQIDVQFFYAYYLDSQVYKSDLIKVKMGMTENCSDYEEVFHLGNIRQIYQELNQQGMDKPQQMFGLNMENEYVKQLRERISYTLKIKNPVLAKYIKVIFIGKQATQETDDLYYIAVDTVKIYGYGLERNGLIGKTFFENYRNFKRKERIRIQKEQGIEEINDLDDDSEIQNMEQYYQNQANRFKNEVLGYEDMVSYFNEYPAIKQNMYVYQVINENPSLRYQYLNKLCAQNHYLNDLETGLFILEGLDLKFYDFIYDKDFEKLIVGEEQKQLVGERVIAQKVDELIEKSTDSQQMIKNINGLERHKYYQVSKKTFKLIFDIAFKDLKLNKKDQYFQTGIDSFWDICIKEGTTIIDAHKSQIKPILQRFIPQIFMLSFSFSNAE